MLQEPLRERQDWALNECRAAVRQGTYRMVVQGPCGFGKTVLGAHIAANSVQRGGSVIFTVPAVQLVNQTVAMFERLGIPPKDIGVIQADHERKAPLAAIQVCSIQTLARRKWVPDNCKVWLLDECHRWYKYYEGAFEAPVWQKKPIIGLSATPWTAGLGKWYGKLIRPARIRELITEGLLADYDHFAPSDPLTSDIPLDSMGEFASKPAGDRMSEKKLIADVVETWKNKWGKPWTFCFAQNRAHAALLLKWFGDAGVKCGYMDAYTPEEERAQVMEAYRKKEIDILVNVGVLVLGVDEPCDCIILAMITMSEMKYVQICGRGIRPGETQRLIDGKKRLMILDHGNNYKRLDAFEEINYANLDEGKGVKPSREKRELKPTVCPKCSFLKMKGERACPVCNYVPVVMSRVQHVEGELVQMNGGQKLTKEQRDAQIRDNAMKRFYADLLWFVEVRGYKPGFVYKNYIERYALPPPKAWEKKGAIKIPYRPSKETWEYLGKKWNQAKLEKRAAERGDRAEF